jgi:valyl-tRNA synthetase
MNVPKKFWSEEAEEPAHKDIKKALEEKAGLKKKKPMEHAVKHVKKTKKVTRRIHKDKKGDCPTCGK